MIKRWIQRLRTMRVFSRHWPLCAQEEPEWTEDDGKHLYNFLITPTGKKLVELMRYREQSANSSAVMRQDKRNYSCGWAAGMRGAFAWVVELSHVGSVTDDYSNSSGGAEELAEPYTP